MKVTYIVKVLHLYDMTNSITKWFYINILIYQYVWHCFSWSISQQRRAFTKVVQNSYMLAVVLWRCFFYYDVGHAAFPTWLVRSTLGKTSRANQIGELNTTIELNCFGMQFVALFFFLFYPSDFPKNLSFSLSLFTIYIR